MRINGWLEDTSGAGRHDTQALVPLAGRHGTRKFRNPNNGKRIRQTDPANGILQTESCRPNPANGILQTESGKRNPEGR